MKFNQSIKCLPLLLGLLGVHLPGIASAADQKMKLSTYVVEWGGYSAPGSKAYPIDGSYPSQYHSLEKQTNPDMVSKFAKNDVVNYSFLQVWNPDAPQKPGIVIPREWAGHLHFDDIWANLPSQIASEYPAWKRISTQFPSVGGGVPEFSAVQLNGMTQQQQLFDFTHDDVGQMNNFGAFLKLGQQAHVKRVISIGGANTTQNNSISTYTFQAIFNHTDTFIESLKKWQTELAKEGLSFDGVDYDFEPPIDAQGGQLPPGPDTLKDYQHLFEVVKATRNALGQDKQISVTITVNKEYLNYINQSVPGGWFKQIAPYVNSINLMTYDLHGPWSLSGDPGTLPHAMVSMPDKKVVPNPERYAISYAMDDVIKQVLTFGVSPDKLQFGLASYGRGFAGVKPGASATYPGLDQAWTGPSKFDPKLSNQDGFVPYKSIAEIINTLGYKPYEIKDTAGRSIASYIYNPEAGQFVGYQSLTNVDAACTISKSLGLKGAIMWSMDTDAEGDKSLTEEFSKNCN